MKSSSWFIILKDDHVGPFSFSELKSLAREGEITGESQLWKTGDKHFKSANDFLELVTIFKQTDIAPPPLPDLPPLPSMETAPVKSMLPELPELPEIPSIPDTPKVPKTEPVKEKTPATPEVYLHPEVEQLDEVSVEEVPAELVAKQTKISHSLTTGLAFGFVMLMVSMGTFSFMNSIVKDQDIIFDNISEANHKKLNQALKGEVNEKSPVFTLALSRNADRIWVAGNYPHESNLYLTFSSLDKRILSTNKVIFKANVKFENKHAYISKFNFVQGNRIVPGEYQVEISGRKTGLTQKLDKFLNKSSSPFSYTSSIFLFGESKNKFETRLKVFKKYVTRKKLAPLRDILEKYKTFRSILGKIEGLYVDVLSSIKRGKDIRRFEGEYAGEVGFILQELIIDNVHTYKKVLDKDPIEAKNYQRLLTYSKTIGELASDMVTETQKEKRINPKKKDHLLNKFTKKVEKLKNQADIRIQSIENLINKVNL